MSYPTYKIIDLVCLFIMLGLVPVSMAISLIFLARCPKGGFHIWLQSDPERLVLPPLGPFDGRSEADRTQLNSMQICAKCGTQRNAYDSDLVDI